MNLEVLEVSGFNVICSANGEKISSNEPSHSSRKVFKFPTFVLKFECGDQNAEEIRFYNEILEAEDAHFFPKLLGSGVHNGESFLIQEFVDDSFSDSLTAEHFEEFRRIRQKYNLQDLVFDDDMRFNVAVTAEGQIKIYDIGRYRNFTVFSDSCQDSCCREENSEQFSLGFW